jgi:phosphate transport system permease protein
MSQETLEAPAKGPTFHPLSPIRKIKNKLATILFATAFAIATVPLVWVIFTVLQRGVEGFDVKDDVKAVFELVI